MFMGLGQLWYLDLSQNQLTNLSADIFVGLLNLQLLYLDINQLTSLPANIFVGLGNLQRLNLHQNRLTNLTADTFEGLGDLQTLSLHTNQLTSLPADIFEGLVNLQVLYLHTNQLTRLPAGMFVGLGSLQKMYLQSNQLTSLPAEIFVGLGNLQRLSLSNNKLTSLPAGISVVLRNLQTLWLNQNKLETLPPSAYDTLASISNVQISDNPWQCDCRMAPFRQRMNGSYAFEGQMRCAGPANLQGEYLRNVNPEDLICVEIYSTSSTKHMVDSTLSLSPVTSSPPSLSPTQTKSTGSPFTFQSITTVSNTGPNTNLFLSVPLLATLCVILGLFIIFTIAIGVWCARHKRRQRDPTPLDLQGLSNTSPTGTSSGHDQIRQHPDINVYNQSGKLGTEDSQHIYNIPTDDVDTAFYETIGKINQSENSHKSLGNGAYTQIREGPSQRSDSGQIQHLGSFNDGYEVPSPSLCSGEGPQSHKYVDSHVEAAAKDAAAGQLGSFNDGYEVPSPSLLSGQGPQSHKYVNSHMMTAAAKDAAAVPQVTMYKNDNKLVDNQSQILAAPGADSPHHYEPLRNPSSQQQHTYTSPMPHGLKHN
ncbi:uncharacterized protein LOC144902885 [Branchiostoma floridae x Branchiostoma belcheri]